MRNRPKLTLLPWYQQALLEGGWRLRDRELRKRASIEALANCSYAGIDRSVDDRKLADFVGDAITPERMIELAELAWSEGR